MKTLQILGAGCPNCKKLAENTEAAAQRLGISDRTLRYKLSQMREQGYAV